MIARLRGRRRGQAGAATAELALGIPLLVALTAGLVWMLAVGAAQVRVVDASREAARAVARGDDVASAEAVALRIAPDGARVRVEVGEARVVVTTSARVSGPGGLLASLPGVTVSAEAVALAESSMTGRGERGAATILVVAMAGVLMFVMTGLAAAGGLVTAQRRAQAAADLAALAGASHLDEACAEAGEVAAANAGGARGVPGRGEGRQGRGVRAGPAGAVARRTREGRGAGRARLTGAGALLRPCRGR